MLENSDSISITRQLWCSPIGRIFRCGLLVLVLMAFALPSQSGVSQEDGNPEHSIARLGEFGNTPEQVGIYRLAFSHDGKFLASRNRDNIVTIYDLESKKQLCEIEGHDNFVNVVDFSPDSEVFLTAAGSGESVKIWNTQTGKLITEIETDGSAAYFAETGDAILVLGETDVQTYSWPGGQLLESKKWRGENETRVSMSRDGRFVVSYRALKRQIYQTQILDLDTKSKIVLDGPTSVPRTAIISPDRLWVSVAYHRDSRIRLWSMLDPHQKKYTLNEHTQTVQSISFTSDSRFLISSSWDKNVIAWDLLTRQSVHQFKGHQDHVNATACAPFGFRFATGASGGKDCSTIVWDFESLIFEDVEPPTEDQFARAWEQMGLNNLETSLRATSQFVAGGESYLDRLETQLGKSLTMQSVGGVDSLLDQLNSPEFAIRENATAALTKIRSQVEPALRQALRDVASPEIRFRLMKILKTKIKRPRISYAETRRWNRVIMALEKIGTERSQGMLKAISDGHSDIDISNAANSAFKRVELAKP